jgi:Ala-tRNA(Pro) deacylase
MAIPASLKLHLEKSRVSYWPVSHVPTAGSQYAAMVLHVPGKQVAKTVVLRSEAGNFLAVLPASYHINLKTLGAIVGKPVGLLEEHAVSRLFPDCEPGAIPPFGELYQLPVYLDKALAEDPEIVFGAGTHTDGIRMSNSDFLRLAHPQVCSFAEKG